jgi:GNAT superfamily N-acetyltransferase
MATPYRAQINPTPSLAAAAAAYEIKRATAVPAAALNRIYDRMFPERAEFLKEHWRWLYRVGSYDWAPAPLVATTTAGQVIGHAGVIPILLRSGRAEHRATWFVDLAILPDWQRQGVGQALIRASLAQCPLHLGFCNERSLGALLQCGWLLDQRTQSLQLLLRPELHPKLQNSLAPVGKLAGVAARALWRARAAGQQLEAIPATTDNLAQLWEETETGALHVRRSPEFLRWRIVDHPHASEHFILRASADSTYAALARLTRAEGFHRLHLLALQMRQRDADALSKFFAGIVRWALAQEVHRILMVTSDAETARVARRWFPIATNLRFIYCSANEQDWQLLDGTEQLWECIDNDFDLT